MRDIALTKGMTALVDDEDYDWISQYKWSASGDYAFSGRHGFMHRFIMSAPKGMVVDHINMNCLDNRRSNLRICTRGENSRNCNARADRMNCSERTSKYKGVAWKKQTKKWQAYVTFEGKYKHLGYFHCEEDAARAHNAAARELHKEFARLNNVGPN